MKVSRFLFMSLVLASCLLLSLTVDANAESELTSIRFVQKEDRLEVTVEVKGDFSFDTFSLIGPKRLVLDLSPVENIKASPVLNVNACGVIRIRCGQFKPEVARIVFDLTERVPSHKISRTADGLGLLFWLEEESKAEAIVPEVKEEIMTAAAKPAEKPSTKPAPVTPPASASVRAERAVAPGTRATWIRLQAGLAFFPSSILTINQDLTLYDETGSLSENYKGSLNLVFGAGFGKFLAIKEKQAKLGADFSLWSLSHKGSFVATLPHPFLPSTARTLPFEEKLNNSLFQISAYFLYPVLEKQGLSLWVGPAVGYTFGKFTSLEDFSVEDNPPYSSNDLILSNTVLVEESISDFIFEAKLELNYHLTPRTLFFAQTALSYFNPKVANLGKRARFLQFPLFLGLEFRF
ncbi:MAG: AMIN domain-containing protein [Candidatus Aminicenantales bacterium]